MSWLGKFFAVDEERRMPIEKITYNGIDVGYKTAIKSAKVLYQDLSGVCRGWLNMTDGIFYDWRGCRRRRTPEQFLHDVFYPKKAAAGIPANQQ
ncbi:MAG: hypothetical protein HY514_02240 [Candidatus Aenigmarchaeota archaeon]|nr:hypothetical protein [Candidatus Aenigmarchaeota archaeon]